LTTVADESLVIAARRGDNDAFAALVARYSAAVRAVACHVVRDHHASEDIAQDVFVTAHRRLSALRAPSLFGRWVLQIARHRAVRSVRARQKEVPLDYAAELACPSAGDTDSDMEPLLKALMRLPERERRLMMLRFFNGNSIEEVARITGRPVGTVTKQLSRGYARLRGHLAEALV
jgi:RNA polymerase sigma-70 factor (ECF subfamily)